MHHGKTKHFAIKLHFVRELVENQKLELSYLTTINVPADTLTKSLGIRKHSHFRTYLLGETQLGRRGFSMTPKVKSEKAHALTLS